MSPSTTFASLREHSDLVQPLLTSSRKSWPALADWAEGGGLHLHQSMNIGPWSRRRRGPRALYLTHDLAKDCRLATLIYVSMGLTPRSTNTTFTPCSSTLIGRLSQRQAQRMTRIYGLSRYVLLSSDSAVDHRPAYEASVHELTWFFRHIHNAGCCAHASWDSTGSLDESLCKKRLQVFCERAEA
ncbi:hypothetical protein PsYK624_011050 [Phanerochaete sordida]|uniref:Uncharacterized protein n=1 Tax=Phanerochaete sordida TaxID=48140 RepID=A0A9P3FYQ1_9APHY|nr:hypothetical protein PsYK624_011050 [Phanerochaete sordida]